MSGAASATTLGRTVTVQPRIIKPLASVKRHPCVVLLLAGVLLLLGLPIVWLKGHPIYRTEATIQVSPRFAKNLSQDSELDIQSGSQYREFVRQQVRTITRYDVVEEGLKRLGDQRSVWQKPEETERRATEQLIASFDVEPIEDTYLVSVALEGLAPVGLAETVNTVVNVYLERQKSEEFFGSDIRVANLRQRRQELLGEIQNAVERQTAIGQELGLAAFEDKFLNPYDKALIDGSNALAAARRRRMKAEAKFNALEERQKQQQALELESVAREMTANDRGLGDLNTLTAQRRNTLVAKLNGLAEEHPGRAKIEHDIADLDAKLTTGTEAIFKRILSTLRQKRETALAEERARTREEVEQAKSIEVALTAEVDHQKTNVAWFSTRYNEALTLRGEIERSRKQLDAIDDRLDFISLESKAPGFVRLVSPARAPEEPTKGGRTKLLVILLGVAGVVSAGAAVAIDYFDDRIRTPFEAEQAVGYSAVGWILEQHDAQTRGFAIDQLRRLALALDRERRAHNTRRFALTSVKPGGGASQMTLELARALGNIGVRTIAVELNAFKPDARYKGGVGKTLGVVGVLAGEGSVADAIVPSDASLPDRLPIGDITEGRHLSTGSHFLSLLQTLSERYDLLLFDTPPILLSADAELFTGIADATFLVIGAESVSVGEVRRAAKLLERLAPSVVGFIVNRVRIFGAGGYFADLLKEYETGERQEPSGLLARWLWTDKRKNAPAVRATQWKPVRDGTDGARDARRDEQYL